MIFEEIKKIIAMNEHRFQDVLDNFSQLVGVQDWLALIALIITVIGLTSLAEKRTVIGVDYGKYLMDEYRIFGIVRVFHILIGIAIINAVALVVMLHNFPVIIEFVVFVLLILSAWFVLVYLFSYVLRIHPKVKREIYKKQILGLYVNSNTECNFEGDRVVGMHGGDRTPKKISSNVQSYFNLYNEETIVSFVELFGPKSPVYSRTKHNISYWKKMGFGEPHDYSISEDKSVLPLNHISWEFFQMYRFSDIQDRWLLEILNLFNGDYANQYPRLRLYNVARILGQINRVGFVEGLWKYKFLDYFMPFIIKALDSSKDKNCEERVPAEEYLHMQLALYLQKVFSNYHTQMFEESTAKAFNMLLSIEHFCGVIPIQKRIQIYLKGATGDYKKILDEAISNYNKQQSSIKNIVLDFGNVLVDWSLDNLFKRYYKGLTRESKLYKEVLSPEWIREVDASNSLKEIVDERIRRYPRYKKQIELFYREWDLTVSGEIDRMLELVKELKKKYRVYGLSNWCKELFLKVQKHYPILNEIDNYIISGGLVDGNGNSIPPKPSKEIYEYFLNYFCLDAVSCFFVDDKIENVNAARALNIKSICFKDAQQLRRVLL